MTVVKSPLTEPARKIVGDTLQGALVDLIDLSLIAKQVHWNVIGPRFRSIHLQLDEVVSTARTASDTVADPGLVGVACTGPTIASRRLLIVSATASTSGRWASVVWASSTAVSRRPPSSLRAPRTSAFWSS